MKNISVLAFLSLNAFSIFAEDVNNPAPNPNQKHIINTINALSGNAPLQDSYFSFFLTAPNGLIENNWATDLDNSFLMGYQEAIQEEIFQLNEANIDQILGKRSDGMHSFGFGVYDQIKQNPYSYHNGFRAINESGFVGITKDSARSVFLAAAGYGYTSVQYTNSQSRSNSNNFMADFACSVRGGRYQLVLDVLFLNNIINQKRYIQLFDVTAHGTHLDVGTKAEGYWQITWNMDKTEFALFERLGYIFLWETAYTENGAGGLNYQVGSTKFNMLRNQVGIQLKYNYNKNYSFDARGSWVHEQRYGNKSYQSKFIGTQNIIITNGYMPTRELIEGDFRMKFNYNSWDASLVYTVLWGQKYLENTGRLQIGYKL